MHHPLAFQEAARLVHHRPVFREPDCLALHLCSPVLYQLLRWWRRLLQI